MTKRSAGLALSVAVAAALLLSACGGSSGSSTDKHTLRGTYASFPDYLDPALSFTLEGWTSMWNTYIPLLTYAHATGEAGSKVIPGLARTLPEISDGGRTYTLVLRKGLEYSDGTPVRASDFTRAVRRLFILNASASTFYTGIVGAERFARTKRGGIPGIETDDATGRIVIHLTEPRSTFVNELALIFVAPLPPGTPNSDVTTDPPPATGPYVITESHPGRSWKYERNPQWLSNNAKLMPQLPSGHVDRIENTVIRNTSTQVNDVEKGTYDWMQNIPPPDRYPDLKSRFEGTQLLITPQIDVYYFWMNTRVPPFDDLRVRRAVNYAIDPEALERIYAGQLVSTQQILPLGMPGHEEFKPYPHDLAKAKALIAAAKPSDRDVTVWTIDASPNREAGEYYEGVLRELGFETTLKVINADNYFTVIGNLSTPELDTGWGNWFLDYPHPNDYFAPQLTGPSIAPTNNTNWAQLEDPALDAKVAQLSREELGPKQEAQYAALDREFMARAPWAPYGTLTLSTFVASQIDLDKLIASPIYGQDLTSFQFK